MKRRLAGNLKIIDFLTSKIDVKFWLHSIPTIQEQKILLQKRRTQRKIYRDLT